MTDYGRMKDDIRISQNVLQASEQCSEAKAVRNSLLSSKGFKRGNREGCLSRRYCALDRSGAFDFFPPND